MVFFFEITNIWQKSWDFWSAELFPEIFKILAVLNVFHQCFVWINFVSKDGVLCTKEIHRLGPMDLNIYSLERKTRLWLDTDSWQSLENFAKIISVTSTSDTVTSELRIRDVYPGSRILIFVHPGSRISDPGSKNSNKRGGLKKN